MVRLPAWVPPLGVTPPLSRPVSCSPLQLHSQWTLKGQKGQIELNWVGVDTYLWVCTLCIHVVFAVISSVFGCFVFDPSDHCHLLQFCFSSDFVFTQCSPVVNWCCVFVCVWSSVWACITVKSLVFQLRCTWSSTPHPKQHPPLQPTTEATHRYYKVGTMPNTEYCIQSLSFPLAERMERRQDDEGRLCLVFQSFPWCLVERKLLMPPT